MCKILVDGDLITICLSFYSGLFPDQNLFEDMVLSWAEKVPDMRGQLEKLQESDAAHQVLLDAKKNLPLRDGVIFIPTPRDKKKGLTK